MEYNKKKTPTVYMMRGNANTFLKMKTRCVATQPFINFVSNNADVIV